MPGFVLQVEDYEAQQLPESRFVRVVDKWMPIIIHFLDNGAVLDSYIDSKELILNSDHRSAQLRNDYPEFDELIKVREELVRLASQTLLNS